MEFSDNNLTTDRSLRIYEHIVNNSDRCIDEMPVLFEKLKESDSSGQFLASTARYLSAVDPECFKAWIPILVEATIEKDRERKYIGSLLEAIWGKDYQERAEELRNSDDNFRRIYKRIYPDQNLL